MASLQLETIMQDSICLTKQLFLVNNDKKELVMQLHTLHDKVRSYDGMPAYIVYPRVTYINGVPLNTHFDAHELLELLDDQIDPLFNDIGVILSCPHSTIKERFIEDYPLTNLNERNPMNRRYLVSGSYFMDENGLYHIKYQDGIIKHLDNGKLHSLNDKPAIIYPNGDYAHYSNGKLHNDDGFATSINGVKAYYHHGRIHNNNGPAVVYPNGCEEYYINDNLIRRDGIPPLKW